MAIVPLIFLTSLAAAASVTAVHVPQGRAAPLAPILRRQPAATTTAASAATAAAASTTGDASASTSSATFCCFEPETDTLPASFLSSCESRLTSFYQGFPTPPSELDALPFYSGDPCTTSIPSSLASLWSSYESEVISYAEPRLSAWNSMVESDCTYLTSSAMVIVNSVLVDGTCSTATATRSASAASSSSSTTAATATGTGAAATGSEASSSSGSSTGSASQTASSAAAAATTSSAASSGSVTRGGNTGFVGVAAVAVCLFLGAVVVM